MDIFFLNERRSELLYKLNEKRTATNAYISAWD